MLLVAMARGGNALAASASPPHLALASSLMCDCFDCFALASPPNLASTPASVDDTAAVSERCVHDLLPDYRFFVSWPVLPARLRQSLPYAFHRPTPLPFINLACRSTVRVMTVAGLRIDIDTAGRAVLLSSTAKDPTRLSIRPARHDSTNTSTSLSNTRTPIPTLKHSTAKQPLSQRTRVPNERAGTASDDEKRSDDEGGDLLKQFTFASPSPKRKKAASLPRRESSTAKKTEFPEKPTTTLRVRPFLATLAGSNHSHGLSSAA